MKIWFSCIGVIMAFAVVAQPHSVVPKNIRAANTLDYLFDANGLSNSEILYGIPLEPGRVVGDAYLNTAWQRSTILLNDGEKMIKGYDARYDIIRNEMEIKTNAGVKVLPGKRMKSFVWLDSASQEPRFFVNAADYKNEDEIAFEGFFEVLAEGPLTLLSRTSVTIKKPNYNVQLDIGERNTRILKRTDFYYLENNLVKTLPAARKKLLLIFGDHAAEADNFISSKRLSLKRADDLKALFEHHNGRLLMN